MFEFITDEDSRGQVGIGTLIVFIAMVLVAAIAAGVLINTAGFLQTQAEDTGTDSTDQVANNINVIGAVADVNDPGDLDNELYNATDDNPEAYQMRITVQKSPGAADVDLSGLSIQYVGENSFSNIVHATAQHNDDGELDSGENYTNVYLIQPVTAETEDDTVMTSTSDRYDIVIPTGVAFNNSTTPDSLNNSTNWGGESYEVANEPFEPDSDVDINLVDGDEEDETLDNTDLNTLKEGDAVELTITTDSGSQRYVNLQMPDSLVGEEGGTVQL